MRTGRLSILAILALMFLSCSEKEPAAPTYTIGFSQCAEDTWRQMMMIQMEAEVSKYPDIRLVTKVSHNDTREQAGHIRELLDSGVDLLIVSPNESVREITEITESAYERGIPTVIYDRKIDSDKYSTYIGADNYLIGRAVGEYVRSVLPAGSSILEISGLAASSPAKERHQGFIDVVDGAYRLMRIDGNWIPDVARARVEDLGEFGNIDLVFGHNDEMALAAYDVIKAKSPADVERIKFIGIDAIVGVDAVIDGRLDASFLYPPGGDFVIDTAVRLLHGGKVSRNYTLKSAIVDASNAATLKMQSEQILDYQRHINSQREELEKIRQSYSLLLHSSLILVIVAVVLLSIAVTSFIIVRKTTRKNRELMGRNREIERKTDELLAQNVQIEMLADQKLQFFTNLSHEIRTPLTLILNPLDKIEKAVKDPLIEKDIMTLRHNARHLLKVVTQILDFRKIENNKSVLRVQETDIASFVNEIVRYFETYARSENIVYNFTSDVRGRCLWIDKDKMEQVFINLISNAFKNSKKYGVITVSVSENETSVIVEVHDTGIGMDMNTRQHIFDRFYSVGNSHNHGTGIGLHLSKEYVELHSGKIYVNSEPGRFTSFFVEIPEGKDHFPLDTVFMDADTVSGPVLQDDETVKKLLSRKYDDVVLVVEDDDDIRAYLNDELSANFKVKLASNGYDATRMVLEDNVSIVLSDVLMPHINGFQLCRDIKGNIATSHIPVILLTALTDDGQMVQGIAEGADEYIRKPFNIDYVKVKIIRILEERRQLKETFAREFNADRMLDVSVKEIPCADDVFRDSLADYLEANYENCELDVEQMSISLGLSRVQLYRKTKSSFGLSPTDLLRKYRLRKAALLLRGDLSISEIAYATGFSSPAYFTRCFKDLFGVPPTAYADVTALPDDDTF